jgi:hypothetical protein
VNVDGFSVTENGKTTTIAQGPFPFVLDSGMTISQIPAAILQNLLKHFPGAQKDPQTGVYVVDCGLKRQDKSIDVTFGKNTIKVPYNDFIIQWPGSSLCALGAQENIFGAGRSLRLPTFAVFLPYQTLLRFSFILTRLT